MNNILHTKKEIPYIVQELENTKTTMTNENNEYSLDEDIPFIYQYDYLYHGIRNQLHLEILEQIFKTVLTILIVEIIATMTMTSTKLMAAGANLATTLATFLSFFL